MTQIIDSVLSSVSERKLICYGYSRVSKYEQVEKDLSLPAQSCACINAFDYRYLPQGYTWGGMFQDEGVSGGVPLAERPAGAALLGRLVSGNFVITLRNDRIFRNARDTVATVEDWIAMNVGVYLAKDGLEVTDEGTGKMIFLILAAVAEGERNLIKERTKEALHEKMMRGERVGRSVPMGFRLCGKLLVADNDERAVMGRILKWREEGSTIAQIHHYLKTQNIRRSHTKLFWSTSQISQACQEELKLREIQRRIASGEIEAVQVPPQYRNLDQLSACENLFKGEEL